MCAERDDAAGHQAAGGDDVADLRLQRARRRHLQRRRSAEALRPDAADAEDARRRQRAVVDAFDAPRDFARQHRAEDQAEAPVEPRRSTSAKNVTSATAPRGVRGQPAIARIAAPIGAEVASTWPVMMISDICSVNGIRSQKPLPHASTTCSGDDGVQTSAATNDEHGGEQREDEGVGNPALGPRGQRERGPRDQARLVHPAAGD